MRSANKGRVIITSSRNIMALVIARSLGEKGIEIIGADCLNFTMLSMSKYVQKHEVYTNYKDDPEAFLDDLAHIIKKHKPDDQQPYLLIPAFKETSLIAQHAERFEADINLACPTIEAINKIFPKNRFAQTCQELEINSPKSYLPGSRQELEALLPKLSFPLLSKPYDGSGGRGIQRVRHAEELQKAFDQNMAQYEQAPLLQQMVDGEDYCLTVMLDQGDIKASMAYKNLYQFPANEGSGVVRETVDESPFISETVKLLQPLKWHGIAQVDFMWNGQDTKPYVIEVNPRFWAGLFQSVQSGVDYPWLVYLLYSGQPLPHPPKPEIGKQTKLPAVWLLSVLRESMNLDNPFHKLKATVAKAQETYKTNKSLIDALKIFFQSDENKEPKKGIIGRWQEIRNAENEIFNTEDPTAAIGIIYALAYWAKYHKLPPEIGL